MIRAVGSQSPSFLRPVSLPILLIVFPLDGVVAMFGLMVGRFGL